MSFDGKEFRNAMGHFASGVTVVSINNDGEIHGMTANAFSSVSLNPPLVLVCVDHRANSLEYIKKAGYFGVNMLKKEQVDISRKFAKQRLEQEPEFSFRMTKEGTPLLEGSLTSLNCKVYQTVEAGDHTIFIGEVLDLQLEEGDPLCFFKGQYTELV